MYNDPVNVLSFVTKFRQLKAAQPKSTVTVYQQL
jgi:hypothetical protein